MAEDSAVRFTSQVTWTMANRLTIAASSLIAGAIVARWLGPGGVGVLAALAVVTLLAINFGGLGLPSSLTFLVARDEKLVKPLLVNAAGFGAISGVVLAWLIVVVASRWPGLLANVPANLLSIAVAALPFQMLAYLCLAVYLGLKRILAYNLIDLSLQAIILVNALVTLVFLGLGLAELVTFGAIANAIAGVVIATLLISAVRNTAGTWRFDGPLFREMFNRGFRFFIAMAAGLVILRGDLLIVNYFRGADEAGVYAVSTQIATFLHMMPNVISTLLFPRTAGARDETGRLTCRVTRHSVFIMVVICVASVPMAFILPQLYGPGFADVPWQFLILLPGIFLLGIETIQVQHFTGLGLPYVIPLFWIVVMLLNFALNFTLVPKFGAYGAAAASSLSYVAIFILVAAYFRSTSGRTLKETFVLQRSELVALVSALKNSGRLREGKA